MPLILKAVRAIYTPASIGIGASFNTSLAGISTALAQPLIGSMFIYFDPSASGQGGHSANAYTAFIWMMAAISTIGGVAALGLKFGQPINDTSSSDSAVTVRLKA